MFYRQWMYLLEQKFLVWEISYCYGQPVDIIPITSGHSGVVSCKQET